VSLNRRCKTGFLFYFSGYVLGLFVAVQLITGCDYARMKDDEAVNTYQTKMPAMPAHTVPVGGGFEALRTADPRTLANPLPAGPESVEQGRIAYGYYCIHCHGPQAEGYGTVGQSFSPLPANLKAPAIQTQSDGELFAKISLGYKRCPPLAYTVAEKDRWAVINYLRCLAAGPAGAPKAGQ
jgi:mono/diheme cytochrome c family protein